MIQTDSIDKLAGALAAAQIEIRPVGANAVNPHYDSKYADLAAVTTAVLPALNKHGLSVAQFPGNIDETGRATLTTILMHSSGQYIQTVASCPLQKPNAHGLGAALTYLRRYSLAAVAGLAVADDDGNGAVADPPGNGRKNGQVPVLSSPMPTGGMVRKFNALGKKNHGQEWETKRPELVESFTSERNDGPIEDYKQLGRDEMQALIDGMSNSGGKSK